MTPPSLSKTAAAVVTSLEALSTQVDRLIGITAATSDRAYAKAHDCEEALAELKTAANTMLEFIEVTRGELESIDLNDDQFSNKMLLERLSEQLGKSTELYTTWAMKHIVIPARERANEANRRYRRRHSAEDKR